MIVQRFQAEEAANYAIQDAKRTVSARQAETKDPDRADRLIDVDCWFAIWGFVRRMDSLQGKIP